MKKLPLGVSDFKELIELGYYYVDKTAFIKKILDFKVEALIIPRPLGFGKTLNLSMLYHFFDCSQDNKHIFQNTFIYEHKKCMEELGQYPTIFISLKNAKLGNWIDTFNQIKQTIALEYTKHFNNIKDLIPQEYLTYYTKIMEKTADLAEYVSSLQILTIILNTVYQKPIVVLIDEYDAAIQDAYLKNYYKECITFMSVFFSATFKDNPIIRYSVITGITKTAKENIFSGLNNVYTSTFFHDKFQDDFGFTQDEVDRILEHYSLENQNENVKSWYNGYGSGTIKVYNPWSVISFAQDEELATYWSSTSTNELIQHLILQSRDDIKEGLISLLSKKKFETVIDDNIVYPDLKPKALLSPRNNALAIWTLLFFAGYITFSSYERKLGQRYAIITIPNKEIELTYSLLIQSIFESSFSRTKDLNDLFYALEHGDVELFAEKLQESILTTLSYFDTPLDKAENSYHMFILGMLVHLKGDYDVDSNQESGYGRSDIKLIPHDKNKMASILEFKVVSSKDKLESGAQNAINQIKEKSYDAGFKSRGIKEVQLLGISFHGKTLVVKQEIINV